MSVQILTGAGTGVQRSVAEQPAPNRGWLVTFSGTGINLALGILYAWSLTKGAIEKEFGWSRAQIMLGLTVSTLVGALLGTFIGVLLDRWGPRRIALPRP